MPTAVTTTATWVSASTSSRTAVAARAPARPRSVVTPALVSVAISMNRTTAMVTTAQTIIRTTSPGWR